MPAFVCSRKHFIKGREQTSNIYLIQRRSVNFAASVHSETGINCFGWVEDSVNSLLRYEKGLYIIPPSTFFGAHGEIPELREATCISNTSIKVFGICKFRFNLHDIFNIP